MNKIFRLPVAYAVVTEYQIPNLQFLAKHRTGGTQAKAKEYRPKQQTNKMANS